MKYINKITKNAGALLLAATMACTFGPAINKLIVLPKVKEANEYGVRLEDMEYQGGIPSYEGQKTTRMLVGKVEYSKEYQRYLFDKDFPYIKAIDYDGDGKFYGKEDSVHIYQDAPKNLWELMNPSKLNKILAEVRARGSDENGK